MSLSPTLDGRPERWWRLLNRYHWFVLAVAALGWVFDCLDQQLFALARQRAMTALVPGEDPLKWGGWATSIFLVGWATGGLLFGLLGDRIGRAKTMMITILVYSIFTGLSAASTTFWDFALYRFLTGLGVGGEFAVGVALVAEVMPDRARPGALGLLQSMSAIGNIGATLISFCFSELERAGEIERGTSWRWMFLVGALPALLALLVRARLKEPARWQTLKATGTIARHDRFTYGELFRSQRWRRNAILGLLLACTGVIGLWGIGFFSPELTRSVLEKTFLAQGIPREAIGPKVDRGASFVMLILQSGAFCGMLSFGSLTQSLGRRRALGLAFFTAMLSTAATFWFFRGLADVWLFFVMGFFQFAPFAIYAIYLPELFPTHLRSTGTSFCYNVGRIVAAIGPSALGYLKTEIYKDQPEPMRNAGITMCVVFLLGLLVVPFAPETRGRPLPEDESSFDDERARRRVPDTAS
jgi:MFS family permease